ncbi:MAG TPA: cyclic nucleotide-binding domain-containing protein [Deltaproteobacteria bacterium]|nr:cyclic nucleotide-binding domain-containing protein [Deltaproteobacteria bacterium]
MALDKKTVAAVKDRAESLFGDGRLRDALAAYGRIEGESRSDPRISLRMGDICRRLGETGRAVAFYRRAADHFAALGFTVKAIAVCKMVLAIDPSLEEVHHKLAALCSRGGAGSGTAADRLRELEKKVPRTPLFSDLTRAEFLDLVRRVRLRELGAGQTLFEEGDPGDSIFIVSGGELEVTGRARHGQPVRLAVLRERDFFGEFSFFSGARRRAAVRALADSEVLEISKADIDKVTARHPRVSEVLFDFYKERVALRLMALTDLFRPLGGDERRAVVARLGRRGFEAGETVVEEGTRGDTMFLIKEGRVEVWCRGPEGGKKVLAELGEGDFFGEVAMATNRPRVASVTALTPLETLVFDRAVMRDVVTRHPEVREELAGVIKRRVAGVHRARRAAAAGLL